MGDEDNEKRVEEKNVNDALELRNAAKRKAKQLKKRLRKKRKKLMRAELVSVELKSSDIAEGKGELRDEEYHQKLEENKKAADEKTAKKREKRLKKKQRQKEKKKLKTTVTDSKENVSESENDNDDEEEDETVHRKIESDVLDAFVTEVKAQDICEDEDKSDSKGIMSKEQEEAVQESEKESKIDEHVKIDESHMTKSICSDNTSSSDSYG